MKLKPGGFDPECGKALLSLAAMPFGLYVMFVLLREYFS